MPNESRQVQSLLLSLTPMCNCIEAEFTSKFNFSSQVLVGAASSNFLSPLNTTLHFMYHAYLFCSSVRFKKLQAQETCSLQYDGEFTFGPPPQMAVELRSMKDRAEVSQLQSLLFRAPPLPMPCYLLLTAEILFSPDSLQQRLTHRYLDRFLRVLASSY